MGNYDWKQLLTPQLPFMKPVAPPPFFGVNDDMAILPAMLMGFQHALPMVGAIVVMPMTLSLAMSVDVQQYTIAASLICAGLFTIVQVCEFGLPKGYQVGTGIVNVMIPSALFLAIGRSAMEAEALEGKTSEEAYGKFLGSCLIASLVTLAIAFLPSVVMKRVFPPMVQGICITLIGVALVSNGIANWGGNGRQIGETKFGYGAAEYIALGSVCFFLLILIEMCGSPMMKNCSILICLAIGKLIAGLAEYGGDDGIDVNGDGAVKYSTDAAVKAADSATFLFVETFSFGVHGSAIFPLCVAFLCSSVETIGAIEATCEVSKVGDEEVEKKVRGGLIGDFIGSFIGALFGATPNTTTAANAGVIQTTNCANRATGLWCGIWLMLFGIFPKVGASMYQTPVVVIGGLTTFVYAQVLISGIMKLTKDSDLMAGSRRARFILALSMGMGLAITLRRDFLENEVNGGLWPKKDEEYPEFRNGVMMLLNTPVTLGPLLAILLNMVIPVEGNAGQADNKIIPEDDKN